MPAPPLSNTAEGGTDTTDVTQANSGGASGDAWSAAPTVGTGCTLKYSATQLAHGTLSYEIVQPVTPATTRFGWTGLGSITTNIWSRVYVRFSALPSSGGLYFASMRVAAGTLSSEAFITTTGGISVHNAAGTTLGSLSSTTTTLSAGSWFRYEWRQNTGAGEYEWRVFVGANVDGASADETKSASIQSFGADSDELRWGLVTNPTGNGSLTLYEDDLAVSTADWLGPAVAAVPVRYPDTFSAIPVQARGRNL